MRQRVSSLIKRLNPTHIERTLHRKSLLENHVSSVAATVDEPINLSAEPIPAAEVLPWMKMPEPERKREEKALIDSLAARYPVTKAQARELVKMMYPAAE